MSELRIVSVAEQVADFLRGEILSGRWSGTMPGRHELAAELGVNHKTVESALRQLEERGLLVRRGAGRGRRIELPSGGGALPAMRFAILTGMPDDRQQPLVVDLKHRLIESGNSVFFTNSSQQELGMDVSRIARLVRRTKVDAWVVIAGSREVLQWFAGQSFPAFSLFGRWRGLRLAAAGPDKAPAYATATRALLDLGHRRIALLTHARRRLPAPGPWEGAFLSELEKAGIIPGAYHLPDWEETPDGLHARLESMFRITPPTALIVDTVPLFSAVGQFLAGRGLRVPEDVSLVCTDESPTFFWCRPSVAHIRWDARPLARRLLKWAGHIRTGREDTRQTRARAEYVPGGTAGPP